MSNILQKPIRGQLADRNHWMVKDAVGWWLENEGIGNKVFDISGNGNHGINNGAIWKPGKFGSVLEFDGTNDFVDIQSGADLNSANLTVSAWIYVQSGWSNFDRVITTKGNLPWGGNGWSIELSDAINKFFFLGSGATGLATSNNTFTQDKWVYVVFTVAGASAVSYINGILDTTGTVSTIADSGQNLTFAHFPNEASYTSVRLDDVRLYNRVLSLQEIQEIYINPFAPWEQRIRQKLFFVSSGIDINLLGNINIISNIETISTVIEEVNLQSIIPIQSNLSSLSSSDICATGVISLQTSIVASTNLDICFLGIIPIQSNISCSHDFDITIQSIISLQSNISAVHDLDISIKSVISLQTVLLGQNTKEADINLKGNINNILLVSASINNRNINYEIINYNQIDYKQIDYIKF